MKNIEMNELRSPTATTNGNVPDDHENPNYRTDTTDDHASLVQQDDGIQMKRIPRGSSASAAPFPIIYEVPSDAPDPSKADGNYVPPPSASSANFHAQNKRRSTGAASGFERSLSILDPMSDRVSTILVWQNLVVSTREKSKKRYLKRLGLPVDYKPTTKELLHNVSGAITGGLWAVMGPSGSGKSTLLNTLACRLDVNTVWEGEMRLNGEPYDNAELKRVSGYVMQDDMLNGFLTVKETLIYTAELRLPRTFTNQERRDRVEEVMEDLGLKHVQNETIGGQLKQGISGSERKRLCVGMQLLNRPQLLFLDEPTTGLDSVTALDLLYTLHALAHGKTQSKAVTIVCSIHQPQQKIFNLFDSLVLLKAGHIIYQGPRKMVTDVFRSAGFPCPLFTNPADHILDVITPPKPSGTSDEPALTPEQQAANDQALIRAQPPIDIDLSMGIDKRRAQMTNLPKNPLWHKQVFTLFRRSIREQSRKLSILATSIIQTVAMGILIGTVFLQIGTGQRSIVRREPVIFFCAINQGVFGALTVINSFPVERTLTLRERASGTYFASAYFIAKVLSDTLVQLPIPIIFTCVVYYLIGLQPGADKFFIFMVFMILCSITSTALALMISAICRTTALSVTVLPMVLEVTRLFGGFFLAPSRLPIYFSWLDALSYIKYTFVGAALNELQGLVLTCPANTTAVANATMNGTMTTSVMSTSTISSLINSTIANGTAAATAVCISNGERIIQEKGYDYINIGGCIGVLIGFIILCRTVAFLGVRFLKH